MQSTHRGVNMHLLFSMRGADDAGKTDHPQRVMQSLGITYKSSEPVSIADVWIFYDCESIPNPLPSFLSEYKLHKGAST